MGLVLVRKRETPQFTPDSFMSEKLLGVRTEGKCTQVSRPCSTSRLQRLTDGRRSLSDVFLFIPNNITVTWYLKFYFKG